MVEIQPIRVELEREEDGRILASVPDLPGVMAYGSSEDEAVRKGEVDSPSGIGRHDQKRRGPLKVLFAA